MIKNTVQSNDFFLPIAAFACMRSGVGFGATGAPCNGLARSVGDQLLRAARTSYRSGADTSTQHGKSRRAYDRCAAKAVQLKLSQRATDTPSTLDLANRRKSRVGSAPKRSTANLDTYDHETKVTFASPRLRGRGIPPERAAAARGATRSQCLPPRLRTVPRKRRAFLPRAIPSCLGWSIEATLIARPFFACQARSVPPQQTMTNSILTQAPALEPLSTTP